MKAYIQSKIAVGLFARELDARSRAAGWGVSSNLAHPGVSPTNLLAAQPGMGRPADTREYRVIQLMSRLRIVGTPETAALPALLAATGTSPQGFFGPRRLVGGPPAEHKPWAPLRNTDDASRLWTESEKLVGARFAA